MYDLSQRGSLIIKFNVAMLPETTDALFIMASYYLNMQLAFTHHPYKSDNALRGCLLFFFVRIQSQQFVFISYGDPNDRYAGDCQ